jgi:acetyl-CoA acetyltransferase
MEVPELEAIVSGLGISRIGRRLDVRGLELTLESARQAIADAGLEPRDIDGVATMGETSPWVLARELGFEPSYRGGGVNTGGLLSPVMSAFLAVTTGQARHVLVYRTVRMLGGAMTQSTNPSGDPPEDLGADDGGGMASMGGSMSDIDMFIAAGAFSAANWLAMHCQRHMCLYGTTKEQLGWLAINSRRNAALNPLAVYRQPMTMDDYLGARPVSEPFGLLDCDVPVDGSIALVVSHPGHAEGSPNPPVRVQAIGGSTGAGGWGHRPDYPKMASVDAAAEMWSRTTLTPADVDVAELYDGFSFLTFAWLEALGLCGDGEAGPFVEGATRIAIDGELPVNTYGGQLSAGRMHGYWVLHEACLQLRGQAGERQVPNGPEVAVVGTGGGPIAGSILLSR